MPFFWRKSGAGVSGRKNVGTNGDPRDNSTHDDANLAGDSRRITLSLSRAGRFAAMLARSRASAAIEVSDLLAGMYISDWEHLSEYWEEEDRDHAEEWLRKLCAISPQRWNSWIELYDREWRGGKGGKPWRGAKNQGRRTPEMPQRTYPLEKAAALEDALKQAEQIAPYRDSVGGRQLPILTSEIVLLCIARSYGTEISRSLAATGIDTTKLEKDALFPRRAPLV